MYHNKLSEMADLENICKLTGVCPQSNVQFDFLTVRENLRLFAKIKGIQPQEVEQEVHEYVRTSALVKSEIINSFCTKFLCFHLLSSCKSLYNIKVG